MFHVIDSLRTRSCLLPGPEHSNRAQSAREIFHLKGPLGILFHFTIIRGVIASTLETVAGKCRRLNTMFFHFRIRKHRSFRNKIPSSANVNAMTIVTRNSTIEEQQDVFASICAVRLATLYLVRDEE